MNHNPTHHEYFQQEALEKLIQENSFKLQSKNEIKIEACEKKNNDSNENKTNIWNSVEMNNCILKKDDSVSIDNIERIKLEKNAKKFDTSNHDNKASLKETVEYMKNKENETIENVLEIDNSINHYENDKPISIKQNYSTKSTNNINNETEDITSEMINNEKLSPHKLKKLVSNSAFKDYNNPQTNKNLHDGNISTFDSEKLFNSENGGGNIRICHSTQ
jgi:hypothetical protein